MEELEIMHKLPLILNNVDPTGALTVEDLKKKKEHNQAMLEISFTLSYAEFDDIKGYNTTKKLWDALTTIYVGDNNVQSAKFGSLRGKFDDIGMVEGENITQYVVRIK